MSAPRARDLPLAAHPGLYSCIGFAVYLAFLIAAKPVSPDGADGLGFKGQLIAVVACVGLSLPFLGASLGRFIAGCRGSSLVFHLFWVAVLATTPFARSVVLSLIYVALTFAVYFSAGNVWAAPRKVLRATFGAIAIVCYAFCAKAALSFDLGVGRQLGALTPNHFAAIALTPALFSFLFPPRLRWTMLVVSGAFIVYIGARGALLAWIIYVAAHETGRMIIHRRSAPALVAAIGAAVVAPLVAAALLASPAARAAVAGPVNNLLALDDPNRGFDSGLSGRSAGWVEHREEIEDHLVAGIGFRGSKGGSRFATTHNAYLDLLKETGVIAAALFFAFLALRLTQLIRGVLSPVLTIARRETMAGVLAGTCAVLFLAFFEAWLLNIGFPIGACALLFYAYQEPLPAAESREEWSGAGVPGAT